jgi:hypothetical protein
MRMRTIAERLAHEDISTLQDMQNWCIENSVEYPRDMWNETGLVFTGWRFTDGSVARFDEYHGKLVEVPTS